MTNESHDPMSDEEMAAHIETDPEFVREMSEADLDASQRKEMARMQAAMIAEKDSLAEKLHAETISKEAYAERVNASIRKYAEGVFQLLDPVKAEQLTSLKREEIETFGLVDPGRM